MKTLSVCAFVLLACLLLVEVSGAPQADNPLMKMLGSLMGGGAANKDGEKAAENPLANMFKGLTAFLNPQGKSGGDNPMKGIIDMFTKSMGGNNDMMKIVTSFLQDADLMKKLTAMFSGDGLGKMIGEFTKKGTLMKNDGIQKIISAAMKNENFQDIFSAFLSSPAAKDLMKSISG